MGEIELYLVRHQESMTNRAKVVQGQTNGRLTPKGHCAAVQLASFLAGFGEFDALYSSDQRRALQTARPIIRKIRVNFVHKTPLLRERDFGELEEKPYSKVLNSSRAEPASEQIGRHFALDGNEGSFKERNVEWLSSVEQRVALFVDHLLCQRHRRVAIVGHQLINSYLVNHLLNQKAGHPAYQQKHNEVYRFVLDKYGRVKQWETLIVQ